MDSLDEIVDRTVEPDYSRRLIMPLQDRRLNYIRLLQQGHLKAQLALSRAPTLFPRTVIPPHIARQ